MKIERTNNDKLKYRVILKGRVILTNTTDEKELKNLISIKRRNK